jgi:small-conductance mechanosensitive channel
LRLNVLALLVDVAPAATYLVVGLLLERVLFLDDGLLFTATEPFRMVAGSLLTDTAVAWLAIDILSVPLAVDRAAQRLVPLDNVDAAATRRFLRFIIGFGAGSWIVAESLFFVWLGDGVPRLILISAAAVVTAACLRRLSQLRPRLRRVGQLWGVVALVSLPVLFVTWVLGLVLQGEPPFTRVIGSLVILAALPAANGIVRMLLRAIQPRLARNEMPVRTIYAPSAAGDEAELQVVEMPIDSVDQAATAREVNQSVETLTKVMEDAASWGLALLALDLLAAAWSIDLAAILGNHGSRTLLGGILDAALTVLVGWYAWQLFEAGLALRLSREQAGAHSRAHTVQPLLRAVGKLVIGAVVLMGALSSLGINIAPLLASAGVVGIAVGFGAQTLVKDLFSGACYLIEDVFRIGDYIEAGSAKGNVERITFRTVALRHQNGPLQFVPYGSLGSVRNNSRDWVIDKFEIPLPITVDSERFRKMVKAIGQQMLEDAEALSHRTWRQDLPVQGADPAGPAIRDPFGGLSPDRSGSQRGRSPLRGQHADGESPRCASGSDGTAAGRWHEVGDVRPLLKLRRTHRLGASQPAVTPLDVVWRTFNAMLSLE